MKSVVIIFLLVLLGGCNERFTDYKYKIQAPSLSGEFRTLNNHGLFHYFEIDFTEAPWEEGRNFPAHCIGNLHPLNLKGIRTRPEIENYDRNRVQLYTNHCYDFTGEEMRNSFRFSITIQNSVPINNDLPYPRADTLEDSAYTGVIYDDLSSHFRWGRKDSFLLDITVKDTKSGDQIEFTKVEVEKI